MQTLPHPTPNVPTAGAVILVTPAKPAAKLTAKLTGRSALSARSLTTMLLSASREQSPPHQPPALADHACVGVGASEKEEDPTDHVYRGPCDGVEVGGHWEQVCLLHAQGAYHYLIPFLLRFWVNAGSCSPTDS